MERVIGYVDGYNLYYSLREKKWQRFYWLNIQEMIRRLLKPRQTLVTTKYFTTIVRQPKARHKRQAVFLEALQTLNDFQLSTMSLVNLSVMPMAYSEHGFWSRISRIGARRRGGVEGAEKGSQRILERI